jgi:flagellar hook-length control protein FliK
MMTGIPVSGDERQSVSPISREVPSFAVSGQADQLPVNTVIAPAIPQQEPLLTGTTTAHSPPVTGNAPIQTNTLSTTPARPEALTTPAFPSTSSETLEMLDLRQNNWGRALGHQLSWLVNNRMQEAEIRVNPPELGPLAIRMSLHQNQTNVAFFCHEAAVREAIENALPRLREMLDNQGISLNQAQVFDQPSARQQANSGEQQSPQNPRDSRSPTSTRQDQELSGKAEQQSRSSRSGGVDDYA